ncbi:pyridoxamine 5'-phosphate oxidase family protein, partial [Nocardioides sp. NPDC000441]|uniref:pyridoxamine 5'-phosphate oxidase family protein n=1 Tax=Nocardioides sp. NPDC000441 TaxID=3154256 RepID=UPI00333194E0
MTVDASPSAAENDEFWRERRVCFLTTSRPDGSPHLVPVGVTFDPVAGVARVISSAGNAGRGRVGGLCSVVQAAAGPA